MKGFKQNASLMFFIGWSTYVFAQGIAVNQNNAAPDASAMLDVANSAKGVLIPRIALTAANSASPVSSPATSLLVYNTATSGTAPNNVLPGYYYWNGAKWIAFSGSGSNNWSLTGNAGTVDGTNFIGTTDAQDFAVVTGNAERITVAADGKVGIGAPVPVASLDVNGSIAYREGTALSLSNGINSDIPLGEYSSFRITGPTAAFTITGLSGGVDGRIVTLYNTTSQAMTIANNTTSSPSSQILTLTGANITTPAGPNVIQLQYNATTARWLVIGGQNMASSSAFQMSYISSGSASFTSNGGSGNIAVPSGATFAIINQCLPAVELGASDCEEVSLTPSGKTSGGRSVKWASNPVYISVSSSWSGSNISSSSSTGGYNLGTTNITVYFYK